jgi:hypothetical protein
MVQEGTFILGSRPYGGPEGQFVSTWPLAPKFENPVICMPRESCMPVKDTRL